MRNKILFTFILSIFLICLASATVETLGTFTTDDCIELIQTCSNCTYNNISSIVTPNSTILSQEYVMTKTGTTYVYNCFNASQNGKYIVNGFGDPSGTQTIWAYDFLVTPNGESASGGGAVFYIGLLAMLVIFFSFSLYGLFKVEDYRGKFALYWTTHILFMALAFISWNMAGDFLTSAPFVISLLKIVWWVSWVSVVPMLILSLAWVFYIHLFNEHFQKLIDKGESPETAFAITQKRRGGWFNGE